MAAFHDARGGACGSSNHRAVAHRRAQPERCGGICQEYVHSSGISGNPAGDRVTAFLDSSLLLYCVLTPIVLWIFACDILCSCTVSVYHISDAMASGDDRPEVNRVESVFRIS